MPGFRSRLLKFATALAVILACCALVMVVLLRQINLGPLAQQGYDYSPPQLPLDDGKGSGILLFTKSNGFRHNEAIPASVELFLRLAEQHDWQIFHTENAAVHNTEDLNRFAVIIWSNVTGDVLTLSQRRALKDFIQQGGGFIALHGTIGNRKWQWEWFRDQLLRVRYLGHPLKPHLNAAILVSADIDDWLIDHLPKRWPLTDEWFSFVNNPRPQGSTVLVTLDESSFSPPWPDLSMGDDHPLVWYHPLGKGRVFVSAIGHSAEVYRHDGYAELLRKSVLWAAAENL